MTDATLEFAEFVAAARSQPGAVTGDPLDAVTTFIHGARQHIAAIETEVRRYAASSSARFVFMDACSPCRMRALAWSHVVEQVRRLLIAPAKIDVGDPQDFLAAALGSSSRKKGAGLPDLLRAWDVARVRRHFEVVVGDPRERRIAELRARVLKRCHDRPEGKWNYRLGEHHTEPFSSFGGSILRLTYHDEHLAELRALVRFVMHLATGADPADIEVPVIYGWTDGEKIWPRAKIYLRQKSPFPGADWMRFTAGHVVEFGLAAPVLLRLQALWDDAQRVKT